MNTDYFKQKLEAEKALLEQELDHLGVRNPDHRHDWLSRPSDTSPITDDDEVAERLEDWDERRATEQSLESRLKSVNQALDRIKAGTYGTCFVCNQSIEADRLQANPAAWTCKTHLEEEPAK